MKVLILGAGCSKAYSQSNSGQRMPIAKDFFKTFNFLDRLTTSRWVLVGPIINALEVLKNVSSFDPFQDEFDIEEIHTLFEEKLFEGIEEGDFEKISLYSRAYTCLSFLFSCVVNEISDGPTSDVHTRLANYLNKEDVVVTFNWDTLLDRALSENTTWCTDNGYYVKPRKIFNEEWKEPRKNERNAPLLLKMHGSANWLTGYVTINPATGEFKLQHNLSPETFFVYEHSSKAFDCWDGRWERVYSPFSYGYYPPNLKEGHLPLEDGRVMTKIIPRSEIHAPKGTHGNDGIPSMPLIIPPVKYKTYDFFGTLFDDIWAKASESISSANSITLIGYSFPITDTKTIDLFRCAMLKCKSIPVVNIVDPAPERIIDLMKLEFGIPESHINVFKVYFDEKFDLSLLK